MKCVVDGCPNQSHEGRFDGDLCVPCIIAIGTDSQGAQPMIGDTVAYNRSGSVRLGKLVAFHAPRGRAAWWRITKVVKDLKSGRKASKVKRTTSLLVI
jgi:hypothetical protein